MQNLFSFFFSWILDINWDNKVQHNYYFALEEDGDREHFSISSFWLIFILVHLLLYPVLLLFVVGFKPFWSCNKCIKLGNAYRNWATNEDDHKTFQMPNQGTSVLLFMFLVFAWLKAEKWLLVLGHILISIQTPPLNFWIFTKPGLLKKFTIIEKLWNHSQN